MNDEEKRFLEQIQKQNEDAHIETRRQAAEIAQGIEQRFDARAGALEQRFDTLEQRFDEVSREMRRHFDTVAEATRAEIQLLAESLLHLNQKIEANSVKIDRLAVDNETFKLAFAHLDRRLRLVEDIVLPQRPS
jgi:phage-related minor tail protein